MFPLTKSRTAHNACGNFNLSTITVLVPHDLLFTS